MVVFIQATTAGTSVGPFNLYSDATIPPYSGAFETGISKAALEAGYISYAVPPGTTNIRVKSMGDTCSNEVIIPIQSGGIIIRNSTPVETIDDVLPLFYTIDYLFPVLPLTTYYGYHTGFSGDIDVNVSSTSENGSVRLYINGMLTYCIAAPPTGPQTITFLGVTINPTDLVEIEYVTSACPS